ncbi:MAG: HD-GYP domain-containing protein [Cellvibrionaceae bacterium]
MNLLENTFCGLNQVLLKRESGSCFEVITPIPEILKPLFDGIESERIEIDDRLPFLQHFLYDAELHWREQHQTAFNSGVWLEAVNERELPLEASAIFVDGEHLLLLQELGERYTETAERLQSARDHLLMEEALEREVEKRTRQILDREEQISLCLLGAAGCRDQETGAHIRRIGLYCAAMAKALDWSPQEVEQIRLAAPMHDIGKIGIPDHILQKPGMLEAHERTIMETHAAIGASMLSGTGIDMMDLASEISHAHHERWDGSGYPQGLSGEEIPIGARMTAIVDIYDALVHKRVYKPAFDEAQALDIMSDMAGSHIDPNLFELFQTLLPKMREIRQQVQD